jgi:hypothetical protein
MEADGWLMLVIVSFLSRSYRKKGTPSPFFVFGILILILVLLIFNFFFLTLL